MFKYFPFTCIIPHQTFPWNPSLYSVCVLECVLPCSDTIPLLPAVVAILWSAPFPSPTPSPSITCCYNCFLVYNPFPMSNWLLELFLGLVPLFPQLPFVEIFFWSPPLSYSLLKLFLEYLPSVTCFLAPPPPSYLLLEIFLAPFTSLSSYQLLELFTPPPPSLLHQLPAVGTVSWSALSCWGCPSSCPALSLTPPSPSLLFHT